MNDGAIHSDDPGDEVGDSVEKVSLAEMLQAGKAIQSQRAFGPDFLPAEVWKVAGKGKGGVLSGLGAFSTEWLRRTQWQNSGKKAQWSPSVKLKGDIQNCGNYRGMKLISHTMTQGENAVDQHI